MLADVEAPEEPQALDLVEAALHIAFAQGLPCGYGQEVRRRLAESFVDRNEFRVTEAYEVEEMLADLEIPDLFDRCLSVRDMVSQVYADQNGITLEFLREAGIAMALLHGGTSTVVALGAPPRLEGWRVALERRVAQHGRRNERGEGHVIDPRSGRPLGGEAVAAVVAPSAASGRWPSTSTAVDHASATAAAAQGLSARFGAGEAGRRAWRPTGAAGRSGSGCAWSETSSTSSG